MRLLHRTTRSLSLTDEGQLYFQQCQQIIQDAEQVQHLLGGQQQEPSGTLKISCPVSFGLSRLRPLLVAYATRYPKVRLDLDLDDRHVDIVAEGIDVSIRAAGQLEDSSLVSRRILRAAGVTLASPAYLQAHGCPASPEELVHHQTISYRYLKQPELWTYEHHDGREIAVRLKSRIITNSPEMELSLCLAGQGITQLPTFNLADELETGQLVELFREYRRPRIDIFLVYPSRRHMPSKVRSFIDFVAQHVDASQCDKKGAAPG